MRCPKCGYISFDHMESCLKCKKDISGSTDIEGTTYHATAPSFLRVPEKNEPEYAEESSSSPNTNSGFAEDDYDFSDPDLDILVDEDDNEGTISFGGPDQEDADDFLLEPDEDNDDEGRIEFDLDEDLDFGGAEKIESLSLDVPDELADISDLAPPAEAESPVASISDGMSLSLDDEMNLDEDLDLDGLDLDLGLRGSKKVEDSDLSLSLDDIDLSPDDIVEEASELDELDMDLGLDALDEAPAPEKERASGSLDGISLSLD